MEDTGLGPVPRIWERAIESIDFWCASHHIFINTMLNLRTRTAEPRSTRAWRKKDVEVLRKELQASIANSETLSPIDGVYNNQADGIDRQVKELVEAIQAAIEISTPLSNPSVYAKPGFTAECKQASRAAIAAKRRYQRNGKPDYLWELYKKVRNHLGHVIAEAMNAQYRRETEERCDTSDSMWKACRWARNRTPREACLPALHEHPLMLPETDSAKKTLILLKKFFTPPPTVDLTDIQGATYNQDLKLKEIQLSEGHSGAALQQSLRGRRHHQ